VRTNYFDYIADVKWYNSGMFKKKKSKRQKDNDIPQSSLESPENALLFPKPRICLFDFSEDAIDTIRGKGFNVTSASLGQPVSVPNNNKYDKHLCLLNHDIPLNLHEFDIIFIDLASTGTRTYEAKEHTHTIQKHTKSYYFLSAFPQTIFDPRPFSAHLLKKSIEYHLGKKSVLVVFSSKKEEFEYTLAAMEHGGYEKERPETHHIYEFADHLPIAQNRTGTEMEVVSPIQEMSSLLKMNLLGSYYEIVFYHPTTWVNGKNVPIKPFVPLIRNTDEEIVSFIRIVDNSLIIVFPQLANKKAIIVPLLEQLLPAWKPDIFPYSTIFAWKRQEEYWLPNHSILMERKETIEKEYRSRMDDIQLQIEENTKKYSFLHDLITESGDALVDSVECFLQWMGFDDVKKMDLDSPALKEEDLQIEYDDKLIVVEVKGIGGTSTDSDCNQINKIKYRRAKERNSFDVFGLYIVNHQRYLPPSRRQNPPFTPTQISDAINEERGLLSTWEMFRLFRYIEQGLIKKSDARGALLFPGLVKFKPDDAQYLGKVGETYHDGTVVVLKLFNHCVHKGDEIWVICDDIYEKFLIENLQIDDVDVEEARNCEVGMKLNGAVRKQSLVYLGHKSL
jgi:hypothetical protein